MARPKNNHDLPAEPVVDDARIHNAMGVMVQSTRAEQSEIHRQLFDLGQQVGGIQMSRMASAVIRAGGLNLFAEIKNSSAFKHLPIKHPDGSVRPADSIREFTQVVFGVSYSRMAEEQQNLQALGDECYEAAKTLGMGRNNLRLIRALPPAEMDRVQEAIRSASSSAEVMTLVEDLAAELAKTRAKADEIRDELQSTTELMASKNETIDKLKTQQQRIKRETPDERLAGLRKEASVLGFAAQAAVQGNLRNALQALTDAAPEGADLTTFMAGLVGAVMVECKALMVQFNLPDVSNAADAKLAAEVAEWADKP